MRTLAMWLFLAVTTPLVSSPVDAVPAHQWSYRFGDAAYQWANSIAADRWGNVAACGSFSGTVDFGGGPLTDAGGIPDIFVARFNAAGTHLWSRSFSQVYNPDAWVAADGFGNVFMAGNFDGTVNLGGSPLTSAGSGDVFLAKLDPGGNHLWSLSFGDSLPQWAASVVADESGSVFVTGSWGGLIPPVESPGTVFTIKFDSNGDQVWAQYIGAANFGSGVSDVDELGNVFVTGTAEALGFFSCFLAKLDPSGYLLWDESFANVDNQAYAKVAVDGAGNAILTGPFFGTVDFGGGPLTSIGDSDMFVAKFDAGGIHLWSKQFGGDSELGGSGAADGAGNVVLTGVLNGTADFGGGPLTSAGNDVFVAQLDAGGNHVWSQIFGDAANQSGSSIATDGADNILITGLLNGTADFGGDPLTSAGNGDVFVAKFGTPVVAVTTPRFESTLDQNFPNPFNPTTTIQYTLSERSSAVLGIYDAAGRLVARLDQGVREPGTYRAEWDGRNAAGRAAGSGVYFYRLEDGPTVAAKKMVLLR